MKFVWFKHDNLKQTEYMRIFGLSLCFKTSLGAHLDKPGIDLNLWDRTFSLQFVAADKSASEGK